MKFTNLEKLLPFGYLILVVLGIVKESVFYYQIGINVLKYSSIMDILISPIADLTQYPTFLITLTFFVIALYLIFWYASKNIDKKWAKKLIYKKHQTIKLTETEIQTRLTNKFLSVLLLFVVGFFLGIGIGDGKKVSSKISNNELTHTHTMVFNTNETKKIYLIGSNSSNYFYVEIGGENVKITPTSSIKSLELIKNEKLKIKP